MPLPALEFPADIEPWLTEVTSEHQDKQKYIDTVSITVQPYADTILTETNYFLYYDLDLAIGVQLDGVGEWVGRTRYLKVPVGNFFTWSTVDLKLGWSQAPWKRPFDTGEGTLILPDESYRILLRAVILANHWDGTIPGAYDAYNEIFGNIATFEQPYPPNPSLWDKDGGGTPQSVWDTDTSLWDVTPVTPSENQPRILIQDYGNKTMALAYAGVKPPDQIITGLFNNGELDLKPVGIRVYHVLPTVYPAAGVPGPGPT